ncbi:uncharacterized protein TNIN_195851 [Trichonephila inaurata madagascariensis]|uniref:Uncharacterized protein n=1 Tax=Trichonephila inaurata madagascariensis TaxID=2747483 RepID=A0A8X6XGC5_9ARAC|nr:uncharacterized protein TNIN_195851 [Trichonephila inaurata madagascariensis]
MERTWGDFCENIDWCTECTPRHVVDCVYDQKKKEPACLCKDRSLVYDYIEQVCKRKYASLAFIVDEMIITMNMLQRWVTLWKSAQKIPLQKKPGIVLSFHNS